MNPAVNTTISRVIQNPRPKNAGSAVKMAKLRTVATTQAGLDFLKCAFAEPDFQNMAPSGVPDGNLGRVLLHSHRSVTPMITTAGQDFYIVIAPIPGYSHFQFNGTPGSASAFDGVAFNDASQLLDPNPMLNINNFRMVSNIVEVVPTMNDMTWQGSISVYKIKIQVAPTAVDFVQGPTLTDFGRGLQQTVYGLQGVVNNSAYDKYVAPFKHGAYSIALSTDPNFKMKPPIVLNGPPSTVVPDSHNNNPGYAYGYLKQDGDYAILGTSEMETIVIKISGAATAQSFVLRRWSCVEYSPAITSTLYPYSRQAPPEDAVALSSYMYAARQIPIAVPYYQNSGFWDTFVNILRGATRVVGVVSGALSLLPGPAGVIAGGIATVAGGVSSVLR